MSENRDPIVRALREDDDFLVVSHEHPDGDALGSCVAMGFLLQALGKRFRLYNASGVPAHFDWLPLPSPMHPDLESLGEFRPRWVVVMDCGDPFRMGKELLKAVDPSNILNIDHHMGNPMFGALNWVDPNMSSVGEMVGLLASDLGVPLSGGLGEAVYLAIVADTGNFCYGNTKPETLELAACIMRSGLHVGDFNARYQNQWSFKRIHFWSQVLADSTLHHHEQVAVVRISRELLRQYEATSADCEGLVEFMRRVKTVRVSVSLREEKDGLVKFSLRSHGPDNVQKVAMHFGGGGHRNAAGGTIKGDLALAEREVLDALGEIMGLSELLAAPALQGGAHA